MCRFQGVPSPSPDSWFEACPALPLHRVTKGNQHLIASTIFARMQSHARGYVRSIPTAFSRATGSILVDDAGRQYLDFYSASGALNYGYNNPVLERRLARYFGQHSAPIPGNGTGRAVQTLSETIDHLLLRPRNLHYVTQLTGRTGACATEAALKLARKITGRQNSVSFTRAFSAADGTPVPSLASDTLGLASPLAWGNTLFMPYDGCFGPDVDTIAYLESLLENKLSGHARPAAVIVETVMGEGGVNVLTWRWLKELEVLCRRYGMLLIMDDTLVGCGRTGHFFSFEMAGIEPDMIALSKSLSGFGLPISLLLAKPDLCQAQAPAYSEGARGYELGLVTAAETLEAYWSDDDFAADIQRKELLVRDWLENIVHSYPGAQLGVRGRGLIQGLVTPATGDLAQQVSKKAFSQGVIVETSGINDEVLKLLPALTIEDDLLVRGLEVIDRCVAEVLGR